MEKKQSYSDILKERELCNHKINGKTAWKDVGECYEGCCDKYKCQKCGKVEYSEAGQ
jgi:hypothetical protein